MRRAPRPFRLRRGRRGDVGAGLRGETTDDTADDPGPQSEGTPPAAGLKKLRSWEYRNVLEQVFEGPVTLSRALPDDPVRASFTSVSAAADCYGPTDIEGYETLALEVAAEAFATSPTPLEAVGCQPAASSDACVRAFIADFGLRASKTSRSGSQPASWSRC